MFIKADSRAIPLKDETIQCCITSPPYWGLRDYGTAKWEGGDEGCDHKGQIMQTHAISNRKEENKPREIYRDSCGKCGAVRKDFQLGLEKTPEDYVANMVAVFREVRRVLKNDGVLWLNLGDSYASNAATKENPAKLPGTFESHRGSDTPTLNTDKQGRIAYRGGGIKGKDLIGIPWRVAFALQADGWYLRSDIIWAKPNPMPESVTDRPTKAHEYIFLMSKESNYYYDHMAIVEEAKYKERWGKHTKIYNDSQRESLDKPNREFRNKRSVWSIPTQIYSGAHFATFPEEIPRLCILAGSRPGDYVLDPFGGSGTTAKVALENGREFIHLDLGYFDLAKKRTMVTPAMAGLMT